MIFVTVRSDAPEYPITALGGMDFSKQYTVELSDEYIPEVEANPYLEYTQQSEGHQYVIKADGSIQELSAATPTADDKNAVAANSAGAAVTYAALTVPELRELAKEAEIDGYSSMKKAELVAALEDSND